MMLKRAFFILSAVVLVFCLSCGAQAQSPSLRTGAVNDDAAVLSDVTAQSVSELNDRSPVRFTVMTRHFLGGADAQQYAKELFESNGLQADDVLLLLVIGEERYAVVMGQEAQNAISTEQLNSLLSAKLRQPFLENRDYDGAVGAFLVAIASQVARTEGYPFDAAGLFGITAAESQNADSGQTADSGSWYNFNTWSGNWWNGFFSDDSSDAIDADMDSLLNSGEFAYSGNSSGFSKGKLILILAVLFFIIRGARRRGGSGRVRP